MDNLNWVINCKTQNPEKVIFLFFDGIVEKCKRNFYNVLRTDLLNGTSFAERRIVYFQSDGCPLRHPKKNLMTRKKMKEGEVKEKKDVKEGLNEVFPDCWIGRGYYELTELNHLDRLF